MPSMLRAGLACALAMAFAAPAAAHVTATPDAGPAGGYFRTAFHVPHGCSGAATTAISITMPDGVLGARPQPKPGWTISLEMRPVDPPAPGGHGTTISETVARVTWRGGPLPNEHFDEFGLSLKLPDRPGAILWFPVVQQCGASEVRWIERPAEGQSRSDLKAPAPFLRLRAPAAAHH